QPPASLDTGRLADRTVAAAVGSAAGRSRRKESDLTVVPLEDFRQPPAEPRTGGSHSSCAVGLDHFAAPLDPVGRRDRPDPLLACLQYGFFSQGGRQPLGSTRAGLCAFRRAAPRADCIFVRL